MRLPSPIIPLKDALDRCVQCGVCMPVCPTYAVERDETRMARGRITMVRAVLDGRLGISEIFQDRITSCIGCLACDAVCPSGVPVGEIIFAAKARIAERQGTPLLARLASRVALGWRWPLPPALKIAALFSAIYRRLPLWGPIANFLPFVYRGKRRLLPETGKTPLQSRFPEWIRTSWENPRGRVAFFPGCVINHGTQEMGVAVLSVLDKLGYDVVIPRGQSCCGIPLRSLGDEAMARKVAERNVALFAGLEVEAILTACASCGMTLKKDYPKLLKEAANGNYEKVLAFSGKVSDIHEFVDGRYQPGWGGKENGERRASVTFHDPCHLKRGLGVHASPRRILGNLPDVRFAEMEESDVCCGFGGTFSLSHYDLAAEIGDRKADNIRKSGAEIVATGCPGCKIHIADSLNRADLPVRVVHAMELLDGTLDGGEEERRFWSQESGAGSQESEENQHSGS